MFTVVLKPGVGLGVGTGVGVGVGASVGVGVADGVGVGDAAEAVAPVLVQPATAAATNSPAMARQVGVMPRGIDEQWGIIAASPAGHSTVGRRLWGARSAPSSVSLGSNQRVGQRGYDRMPGRGGWGNSAPGGVRARANNNAVVASWPCSSRASIVCAGRSGTASGQIPPWISLTAPDRSRQMSPEKDPVQFIPESLSAEYGNLRPQLKSTVFSFAKPLPLSR